MIIQLFRVALCLFIKARPSAQQFIRKEFHLHVNKITLSNERIRTQIHFEKGATVIHRTEKDYDWYIYTHNS